MRLYSISSAGDKLFPEIYPPRNKDVSRIASCLLCKQPAVQNVLYDEIEVLGGKKWPDFLSGPAPLAVSEHVLEIWKDAGLTGYEPIPLSLRYGGKKRPVDPPPYYSQLIVRPWGIRPNVDRTIVVRQGNGVISDPRPVSSFDELCPGCLNDKNGLFESMYSVKHAVFDESSWNGCDIVRIGSEIYATERLVGVSLAGGFTNMRCVNAQDVGDTSAASLTKVP